MADRKGKDVRVLPARIDAVLIQAVIAAALSFAHLHEIASAAGQSGWKSWAYPVSVDLLLVAAWRRLRSGGPKTAGWCWFLVAGWPAVALPRRHAAGPPGRRVNRGRLLGTAHPRGSTTEPSPRESLAAEPTPARLPTQVPAALLQHARKIADAHRTATGSAIDTATLRARLGVSAPLAEAIAAHLA